MQNYDKTIADELIVTKLPHMRELDGMRAIAIGLVFIGHAEILPKFPAGFGVTIFFFLSGFLITTLLRIENFATGKISLKNFYIRRTLRINPPLWISMIFVSLIVISGAFPAALDPFYIIGQAFFFTNYMPSSGQIGGLPIPLWSLAVEEHFYLIFPTLYLLGSSRMQARRIALACAILCGLVLLVRFYSVYNLGLLREVYYWTHTRIDSILFGCILALWQNPVVERKVWQPGFVHLAMALITIFATFVIRAPEFRETLRYTLQGMALFVVFSYILQKKGIISTVLTSRPLQLVGLYSYTLYLVHYPLIQACVLAMPDMPRIVPVFLAGIASMVFAALMYRLVEHPLGRMRQRLNRAEPPASHAQEDPSLTKRTI